MNDTIAWKRHWVMHSNSLPQLDSLAAKMIVPYLIMYEYMELQDSGTSVQ
jgi:hypothetical protein